MKKEQLLLGLLFLCLLAGCAQDDAAAAPAVSFTIPPEGATLPAGEPVNLAIASSETNGVGIVRIELYVEGEYYTAEASYSGAVESFNANIPWTPPGPGEYNLTAFSLAADETTSAPATLSLTITGETASVEEEPADEGSEETADASTNASAYAPPADAPAANPPAPTEPAPAGPVCGNGACESGENCASCESDCGSCCGNGVCDNGETITSCIADCGLTPITTCGDGICEGDETMWNCFADCGVVMIFCGDGICNGSETIESCPEDCPIAPIGDGLAP